MTEEAPVSQELLDTIDRHGKLRTAQVRDVIVGHPDVRVGDPDVAAEIILFTVEMNTHKFVALAEAPLSGDRAPQGRHAGQRVARIITMSTGEAGDGRLCPMSSYPTTCRARGPSRHRPPG